MELLKGKKSGGVAFAWIKLAALGLLISTAIQVGRCEVEPTESQCRPYIEKALKEQHVGEAERTEDDWNILSEQIRKEESVPTDELTETIEGLTREGTEGFEAEESPGAQESEEGDSEAKEDITEEETEEDETKDEIESAEKQEEESEADEDEAEHEERDADDDGTEFEEREKEDAESADRETKDDDDEETEGQEQRTSAEEGQDPEDGDDGGRTSENADDDSREVDARNEAGEEEEEEEEEDTNQSQEMETPESENQPVRDVAESNADDASVAGGSSETEQGGEGEDEMQDDQQVAEGIIEKKTDEMGDAQAESTDEAESHEQETDGEIEKEDAVDGDEDTADDEGRENGTEADEDAEEKEIAEGDTPHDNSQSGEEDEEQDVTPEEDLTKEATIPENLRARDHINQILRLDEDSVDSESVLEKAVDSTLKSLKGLYDNAIKPLEMLYKYRDLSNRHFGDPEIFSKPLILFMGPWSGGKSTTINYLLDNEFTKMSLRTGAEPSPAYFNIMMYGGEEEVLDGTQLAADWTFSGLQKFGQGLLDRLRGYKLPNRLLEKVNIVEIPGILEIRKQVQRLFPFNDACQWFIDRADIIFLVYDPSKLDVGPETEAILDQLKGREYQTRIILNKADQVKPEELMRVQGTLIWNISPLMSSAEPPVMYTTSLWSLPYESGAPTRLLSAQERAFLRDLRDAIDKRVENKIASARRFAVRVRNHAKMVDCYLTTYYNHKTFFGNKKKISDDIIENPQKYHIYEGLSTLTNISRYDLPDPEVYRDFFKLNSLYDFKKLSDTCTYFRGCPINTLDVAIAYDLPELVGKYKKALDQARAQTSQKSNS